MNKHPWEVGPSKHLGFIRVFGHFWAGMKLSVRVCVRFLFISDSERVSVKWLVRSGSKFWFRNTREKSKIGHIQPILAAKRFVSFFLGHPVLCAVKCTGDISQTPCDLILYSIV